MPSHALKLTPAEFRKRSVLVVADSGGGVLISMCRALAFRQVEMARTPGEAIDKMQVVAFDFVLYKWTQPPIDGPRFVACTRASDLPSVKRVPIVIVGEYSRAEIVEGEAGMTEILHQPFSISALANAFEKIIL